MECRYHMPQTDCTQMREVLGMEVCVANTCPEYGKLKSPQKIDQRNLRSEATEDTDVRLIPLIYGGRR